jgi:N-acyl-D-aspartate/D-glutamate deacylase
MPKSRTREVLAADHRTRPRRRDAGGAVPLSRPAAQTIDALLQQDGHAIIYAPSIVPDTAVASAAQMLGNPGVIFGLGDGGAHCGIICDAAYTAFVLTEWLRSGNVTLERAIQNMTREPAKAVGMLDRGLLRAGFKADVNVRATIVSGQVTYREGEATGVLPGRFVRGGQPRPV